MVPRRCLLVLLPESFRQEHFLIASAYRAGGIHVQGVEYGSGTDPVKLATAHAGEATAVLVCGSARRAPGTILDGPFLIIRDRSIPIAWLPLADTHTLTQFCDMIRAIHSRRKTPVSFAALSQRHPRFLSVAGRVLSSLSRQKEIQVFPWMSDRILKEDMVKGIRSGIGCAMYLGHGRPVGWVGYYGTRITDFTSTEGYPVGAILSFCCETASRKRTGLSFSEALVTNGIAAASVGAIHKTLHIDNTRWAVNVCMALREGISSLDELLLHAIPGQESALRYYRIIGDPLAPLVGHEKAIDTARRISVSD